MSLICRSIQNIPCNHTDLLLHFLKFFFLDYCLKTFLQQRNSIKSSVSQVPLKFSLIKTNYFKLRFLRQGFNFVCLLLVRTLWHNFGYFDQQIFRIWISNDWIFFVQEKTMVIIFWHFLTFDQNLLWPKVKQSVTINDKHSIYELSPKLPNDLRFLTT